MPDSNCNDRILPPQERAWDLIGRYVQGTLVESEGKELLELLQNNPEWQTILRHNLMADYLLQYQYTRVREQDELFRIDRDPFDAINDPRETRVIMVPTFIPETLSPWKIWPFLHKRRNFDNKNGFFRLTRGKILFLLPLLLFAFFTIMFFYSIHHREELPSFDAVAKIAETSDVVWSEGAVAYERGQLIDESRFQIESGLLELLMKNGTTLILKGPADLSVSDSMTCFCNNGEVSAHVHKEAIGYKIVTPLGTVIDQGTEFYLNINKDNSRIEVVKGKIDFETLSQERVSLVKNQALVLGNSHKMEPTAITASSSYITREKVAEQAIETTKEILSQRKDEEETRNSNPDLLFRVDFNLPKLQQSENISKAGKEIALKFLGGKLADGPLHGTNAALFQSKKDGITTSIPGELSVLTLYTEIQVDQLSHATGILLASENLLDGNGGILWQITRKGELQVQISSDAQRATECYTTAPCLKTVERGSWVQLAVVIDVKKKEITQYLNGRAVGWSTGGTVAPYDSAIMLKPGKVLIGNAPKSFQSPDIRAITFPMTEFRIYAGLMPDSDLRKNRNELSLFDENSSPHKMKDTN